MDLIFVLVASGDVPIIFRLQVYPLLSYILEEFSESAIKEVRSLTPDFFTKNIQESFGKLGELNLTQSLPILADRLPIRDVNATDDDDDSELFFFGNVNLTDVSRLVTDAVRSIDLSRLRKTLEKASSDSLKANEISLAKQVIQREGARSVLHPPGRPFHLG